jgi:hypothetical protein
MNSRHALDTDRVPGARPSAVASRAMRRSRRLAVALSVCLLGVPALAHADVTTPPDPGAATRSPFKADRLSSQPSGLTPNTAASPVRYPEQAVILTWGEVPKAVGYTVEISDNPGFSKTVWSADVTQPIAVPEILLPDGAYWWRVRAVDAAGTQGVWSDVARVAKTWPNQISGMKMTATPTGGAASATQLNPYLFWNPVPGAKSYDVQVSPGDQFNNVVFTGINVPEPFATPGGVGALPDDTYNWRVRAHDPNDNLGPWTVATPAFTKEWVRTNQLTPADGSATGNLLFRWEPVDGAQQYEIQVTDEQNNYVGVHLKLNATTSTNAYVPSIQEQQTTSMSYGDHWWRVRPIINGVYGKWSAAPDPKFTWQANVGAGSTASLSSTGDTDSGLMPILSWTPVTGANIYRIDIATDPGFTHILESEITRSTSWVSRVPLPDNQVSSGYWWRVVWGTGTLVEDPHWVPSEDLVDTATFRKQTRVTLGSPANGGVLGESPLLSWNAVPGIAKYNVELSPDGLFQPGNTRKATIFGLGAVPGSMVSEDKRLPDGTWSWRVRAVDGGDNGQTWSPVGQFTLASTRPAQKLPNDGATVVFSPLITWSPVSGACSYDVQVGRDPSFGATADANILNTAQTALVPPKTKITTPGVHYWRVRADYCGDTKGQWSPTRSFRSVFPPDFNLNSVPSRVDYRTTVVVGGQLKNNGAGVPKARVYLERRLYPSDTFRPAGMIRTGIGGRFRFALKMSRSADYRLVWNAESNHPEGVASFGIDVTPRVTFRLASSRVVRKSGLLVKGSIYPKRPALIQMKTSDGWQTVRKVTPTRDRFAVSVSTGRLDPGTHRLRLWVPRDAQRRFANVASRQRGVLIYDKFVIR